MKIYISLMKTRQMGTALPSFKIYTTPPDSTVKVLTLEPGECIDVAKCYISDDQEYVQVNEYRVVNEDGYAKEFITKSYMIERVNR